MAGGGRYWWADAGPPWPVGGGTRRQPHRPWQGEPALGARPLAPPTVLFKEVPARHDGTTAFSVEMHFSEAVAVDAAGLEAGLVTVSGGDPHQRDRRGGAAEVGGARPADRGGQMCK